MALAYVVTLALAAALPNWIEPPEVVDWSPSGIAATVVGVTVFIFAGMAYWGWLRTSSLPATALSPVRTSSAQEGRVAKWSITSGGADVVVRN